MEKSERISDLATALNKFQTNMGVVKFDSNNPFYKSKYASLATIVSSVKPVLVACGLSISQLVEDSGGVTTILLHNSGEYLSSKLTLKSVKDDPQGHGSAITYARRYAYAAILGIVSDEDDDGNASTIPAESTSLKMPVAKTQPDSPKTAVNVPNLNDNSQNVEIPNADEKLSDNDGLKMMEDLAKSGKTKEDLKTFIFKTFGLKKLNDICNKHLPAIKVYITMG